MAEEQTTNKNRGGLWIRKDKNGNKFLSGNIEIDGQKHYFNAFKNKFAEENPAAPAYQIAPLLEIKKDEPEEDETPTPKKTVAKTPVKKAKPAPVEEEEDII